MQLARRLRVPALLCSLAVLLCELVSRPYANAIICDEAPFILVAQHLAATGHIVYNGLIDPMLGWQLYVAAAFIKLFGFSLTSVRMSILLVSMVLAFLLQRVLVLTGITERNATIGALALVTSPLYLMLSVTYMTDITGLFAIVICLYGCLHALQALTDRSTIAWLCFAVAANAICGTSRQIPWLGVLVMVPCTLWLLRARRRVFFAGAAATVAGALFIYACMQWFKHQPHTMPEHFVIHRGGEFNILASFFHAFLEFPFLLLPIAILFIPELRKNIRRSILATSIASLVCVVIVLLLHWKHAELHPLLEPFMKDWLTNYGGYGATFMHRKSIVSLNPATRVVLTVVSLGGLLGLITSLLTPHNLLPEMDSNRSPQWKQLGILLIPFATAYCLTLFQRAALPIGIFDRYMLELLVLLLPCMVRYYQERVHAQLPLASLLLVAIMAAYGIACTSDMFSRYRSSETTVAEIQVQFAHSTSRRSSWNLTSLHAVDTTENQRGLSNVVSQTAPDNPLSSQ